MKRYLWCLSMGILGWCQAQHALPIPPALTGKNFNLTIQSGVTQFYPGINTFTYGINGNLLGPTIIVNKGDSVNFQIANNLTGTGNSTTIHWHGLHVSPVNDGGPHQIIQQGKTWTPGFQIRNQAGTFWYHPHGAGKTDLHVSKGIAGMLIVRDSVEQNIVLPRQYGVDDFPVVIQSKALDVLNQIAIATEMDTMILANGVVQAYLQVPAQTVRLRLLNGSSMRSYYLGLSNNQNMHVIASDGGLLDSVVAVKRLLINPGERYEVLLDLKMFQGDVIYLNSYAFEMPNNIYGSKSVKSAGGGVIPEYDSNKYNGKNFTVLRLEVGAPTANPVNTIPTALIQNKSFGTVQKNHTIVFQPDNAIDSAQMVMGPFNFSGSHFNMDSIQYTTQINTVERWRLENHTGIAHPFHIHDVQFRIVSVNGNKPGPLYSGNKDVVLVMPNEYIEFETKFETFSSANVPYMYHCHLLHHEDDGMMGSFLVIDTNAKSTLQMTAVNEIQFYPNPTSSWVEWTGAELADWSVYNTMGILVMESSKRDSKIDLSLLPAGKYFLQVKNETINKRVMLMKE